jgi:hypothetical protein
MTQDQYTVGNLFEGTECLTQETMMKYVDGKLSKEALRQVEMHLIDCPFCDAAVEGIQATGTQAFEKMLHNVSTRIEAHQEEQEAITEEEEEEEKDNVIEFKPQVVPPAAAKTPFNYFRVFGIAASIALLAVVAIMFMGGDTASSIADRHWAEMNQGTRKGGESGDRSTFDQARDLQTSKDFLGAAALYDKVGSIDATFQAGNCYYNAGKYDLAAARFETVVANGNEWVEEAQFNVALCLLKLDRVAESTKLLETIVADEDHNFHKQAKETLEDVKGL